MRGVAYFVLRFSAFGIKKFLLKEMRGKTYFVLRFCGRQDGDVRQSDVRHQMTCSVFMSGARELGAASREPGAGSVKAVSLRDNFIKNTAGGHHLLALFGRKTSGGRFSVARSAG